VTTYSGGSLQPLVFETWTDQDDQKNEREAAEDDTEPHC
jgi:hypothetical protein